MADATSKDEGLARIPEREIPLPAALSPQARAVLTAGYGAARPAGGNRGMPEPALDDTEGWLRMIEASGAAAASMRASVLARLRADVDVRTIAGRPVYIGAPQGERLIDGQKIILEVHGGALVFGGGEALRLDTAATALRTGRVSYSLDYRMPPTHPYPAALDDAIGLYKALLKDRAPQDIVVIGTSAGGNIAAAAMLRARDEGLPLPAGLILLTPEIDLTELGDSFNTIVGLDTVLSGRLMQMNLALWRRRRPQRSVPLAAVRRFHQRLSANLPANRHTRPLPLQHRAHAPRPAQSRRARGPARLGRHAPRRLRRHGARGPRTERRDTGVYRELIIRNVGHTRSPAGGGAGREAD